jgi:hypothetical protein
MAKSHYSWQKRQKELARQRKQEKKRQRRLEKNKVDLEENPTEPTDSEEDVEDPQQ